jgi:diguanylate cyclase (GGDEF)-like protein
MTVDASTPVSTQTLRQLYAVARDLIEAHNLDAALRRIGQAVQDLLRPDGAFLLIRFEDVDYLAEFDDQGAVQVGADDGPLHQIGRHFLGLREPAVITDATTDARMPPSVAEPLGLHTLLLAPFPPDGPAALFGVFWKTPLADSDTHVVTLTYLADLASAAVANVNAARELQRLVTLRTQQLADVVRQHYEARRISETDPLTGLYNRRGFFDRAEEELRRARKQGTSSVLFFCDVDGLKPVNDKLGHEAGDRYIQDCAEILRECFRSSDVVARLGGDEFAVFANDPLSADLIRKRLDYCIGLFNKISRRPYKVSMSTGVIQCQAGDNYSLSDYLTLADEQMYREKVDAGKQRDKMVVIE